MTAGLPSPRWLDAIKREWKLYHLGLPEFRYMFEPPPDNEWVPLDCETTGFDGSIIEIAVIEVGAGGGVVLVRGGFRFLVFQGNLEVRVSGVEIGRAHV